MNMKRKSMAILVSLCFIFTVVMGAIPATYRADQNLPTDISGHWAEGTIITMLNTGVIGGYPDGTFQPNRSITRAEFTTIVNKAFGTFDAGAEAFFTDVKKTDWYYSQAASGKNAGFISGFPDGSFRPNSAVTREQATAILVNLLQLPGKDGVLQFNDADKVSAWARGSVKAVIDAKIINGYPDGTFKPLQPVTRAETLVIVQRALEVQKPPAEPITPSSLEVRVTAYGKAVDKAAVNIFADGKYEVLKTGITDSNGIFQLELAKGIYNITVIKGKQVGFADKVTVMDLGKTTAEIKLTEGVEVQGTLLDKNNKAIKNTEVVFSTNPTFISKTDSAGQFKIILLPNSRYRVFAVDPDKKSEGLKTIATDVVIGSKDETIKDLIAPFTIATTPGGGGGGGGGGSTVTEASVSTAAELDSALNNRSIATITFISDITASPTVTRSLTIDFGAYTLTGNLTFKHDGTGTSVLKGNAGPRITGDLTVDTPNASFENRVTVGGKVSIANVSPNSWTEAADGNTLTITIPGGATITVTGSPGSVTVTEDASGNLILIVSPGAVIDSITTNAPVNIQVAEGATVSEINIEDGAGGTVITNNGTIDTLNVNASINLVANKAPTNITVESGGSLDISGDEADKVPVVSAISITTEPVDVSGLDNNAEVTVTLSTTTSQASIYYTLDGTNPAQGSTLYEGPFTVTAPGTAGGTVTVKAIGIKPNYSNSAVAAIEIVFRAAEIPQVSGSIERDPGNTGGELQYTIEDNTVTFTSGEIKWYPADEDLGRAAGNRVGVQINAPVDFDTSTVKVTIGEITYDWNMIEDGDGYFWWYPLVTQAGQEFTATVVWNESSTQEFKVVIGEGVTLEPAPDTTDPEFKGISPPEGVVNLAYGETFKLEVTAFDENLYELEVDHSFEGTLPEFSVYASEGNPYGTDEDREQFESYGVIVTYDADEQKWTIDFGEVVTSQIVDKGGITFYLVIKDQAGNAWGSMYNVTPENTFAYTVTQAGPQSSTYVFSYEVPVEVVAGTEVVVPVTFATDVKGDIGYNGVRFKFAAGGAGDVTFKAVDSNGVEHTFTNSGYWGPAGGFDIPAQYTATTNWTLVFSEAGEYTITFSLINAASEEVIAGITNTATVEVATATDTTAPTLQGVTPPEGVVNLAYGETFKLEVTAFDENLYELEVDHSFEGTLPEFSVYASEGNPYGTDEDREQFESYGVIVTYDADEQKWTIDFGEVVTSQIVDKGGITFYLVIKDQAGNAWGSMYNVTPENTFAYTVTQVPA